MKRRKDANSRGMKVIPPAASLVIIKLLNLSIDEESGVVVRSM